jgi:DNA-binding transcriptional ArsR family regulator
MCVCDIANVLNMTKSSISHQLAVLKSFNLVKYRKSGKEVYYMLDDEHVSKLYEIGLQHIDHKMKEISYEKI